MTDAGIAVACAAATESLSWPGAITLCCLFVSIAFVLGVLGMQR